jgi:hypothetical protein
MQVRALERTLSGAGFSRACNECRPVFANPVDLAAKPATEIPSFHHSGMGSASGQVYQMRPQEAQERTSPLNSLAHQPLRFGFPKPVAAG